MFGKTRQEDPMFGRHHSVESKNKISQNKPRLFGKDNPNYGKHLSGIKNGRYGKKSREGTSNFFGVYLFKNGEYSYWRAKVCENGKNIHLGQYDSQIEAAKAYDRYVVEYNLNRPLNFPK